MRSAKVSHKRIHKKLDTNTHKKHKKEPLCMSYSCLLCVFRFIMYSIMIDTYSDLYTSIKSLNIYIPVYYHSAVCIPCCRIEGRACALGWNCLFKTKIGRKGKLPGIMDLWLIFNIHIVACFSF